MHKLQKRDKPMAEKMNKELLIALREGKHEAFDTIFELYFNNIKYFIADLVKSGYDAEEIAQEAFLKLWEVSESIDIHKNFRAFLFKISYNIALKHIEKTQEKDIFFSELMFQEEIGESTDDYYSIQELLLKIEMAVEELSERKKEIYKMNVNEGLSVKEIAENLNIDVRTVTNTLRLSINEVREKVAVLFSLFALLA